jgi:hypothetical protein
MKITIRASLAFNLGHRGSELKTPIISISSPSPGAARGRTLWQSSRSAFGPFLVQRCLVQLQPCGNWASATIDVVIVTRCFSCNIVVAPADFSFADNQ